MPLCVGADLESPFMVMMLQPKTALKMYAEQQ